MQNSLFTVHYFEVPGCKQDETVYLIPFGDIHYGAPLCHVEKWKHFCEWAKKKKNALFLGMGDYFDFLSESERSVMNDEGLHESTRKTLEEIQFERIEKFYYDIGFMSGRCIGLIEGNHYSTFSDGSTSTQALCRMLGCKYLGVSAFVRLSFRWSTQGAHGRSSCLDVWAHHGRGASRLVGGSLNTVQQMTECATADIYLMGHDHKKSIATKTRLALYGCGPKAHITHQKILFGRTGSFLRGYVDGEQSYVAGAGYAPTDLGTLKIEMTPKRERRSTEKGKDTSDKIYVDIHGSL